MVITTRDASDVKIVEFEGELDTNAAPEAEGQLNQLIEEGGKKLLLNFGKLDFISSAGLRVLLATAQGLKGSGGDMRICGLNETVQEIFDISGFSMLLSVHDTEENALSSY